MKKLKKKKSSGRNKEIGHSKKLISVSPDQNQQPEEENKFGGIPDRDLRKNLGCG
jgi:hypothetical protein